MTLVSNKATKKLFLTSKSDFSNVTDNVDLILSPEYYWVRKFEIPVKTVAQARHVLPTLFEDIIENITVLTYHVIKLDENQFLCFAYNNKTIFEAIKKSNINISNVNAIYFAQNECKEFKTFEVDSLKFMYTSDGILIKVPNNLLSETINLNKVINNIEFSSEKLNIKLYNDVLSNKYYYALFAVCAVLIVLNLVKYFDYSSEITALEDKTAKVKAASKLPASSIQTKSILQRYSKDVRVENRKREAVSYILSNRKFDLKSLRLDKNTIDLEYMSANKDDVEEYLKKRYKVLSSSQKSFMLKVKVEL